MLYGFNKDKELQGEQEALAKYLQENEEPGMEEAS